jgi:eukaryotic-like serine/threonine-protein kinase
MFVLAEHIAMTLPAGTLLGSYRVTALLGAGGMGEVYRAHDPNLGRDVAIKVLPESVAKDPEALARFEREARAVAALSHPNIRGIFELGHQSDLVFAVMELLEGEPLRTRLLDGPFPQKVALDWALQAARGLAAAHEKGIVHRDLKPENLFVTKDGFVKILDFGLAKQQAAPLVKEETSAPTATATPGHRASDTEPGVVLGTLDYMSPEQVRGLPLDHRSDIFSFGVVLHEMLTGTKAFHRDSVADTMAAITRDEPASTPGAEAQSPAIDELVRHCLEKRPEGRFQSAKDLAYHIAQVASGTHASRPASPASVVAPVTAPSRNKPLVLVGAALAIAAIAVAVALLAKQRSSSSSAPAADAKKRIAVLPFENLGSPEQDYFADGVADEVRGKLTSLASLEVIARGSSTPYKKTAKTPQQIAQELEVSFLLTGTIRWEKGGGAGRVQVTPELVEIKAKGAPASRWQQRFEAVLTDVFEVQSNIASHVARELGIALGDAEEKTLAEKPTTNLEAYDELLRGDEASGTLSRRDRLSLRRAIEFYERAITLDPSLAVAWARLGVARSGLYKRTLTPELAASAKQAAERAIELAPKRSFGYIAMGDVEDATQSDARQSLDWYRKALRLEPTNAMALASVAVANMRLGSWNLAVDELREAVRADPLSFHCHDSLGITLMNLRRLSEARDAFVRASSLEPASPTPILRRAMVELAEGDLDGARRVLRDAPKDVDRRTLVVLVAEAFELGWVLDSEQRALLFRLTPADFDGDKGIWAFHVGLVYWHDGHRARARGLASQASEEFRKQLAREPENATLHTMLGFAAAVAGEKAEAIREAVRATELVPPENDAYTNAYFRHVLARVYILTDKHEKALDTLEPLLKTPYFLTPAWLRIDPTFDPLHSNPRFQKLVAGG